MVGYLKVLVGELKFCNTLYLNVRNVGWRIKFVDSTKMVRKTNIVVKINVMFIIFTSLQSAFDFVNASFLHFVLDLSRLKISYVYYFVNVYFFDACLHCFSTCPFQMFFQKFQVEYSFPTPHEFFLKW